jgi:hypothetical protein
VLRLEMPSSPAAERGKGGDGKVLESVNRSVEEKFPNSARPVKGVRWYISTSPCSKGCVGTWHADERGITPRNRRTLLDSMKQKDVQCG